MPEITNALRAAALAGCLAAAAPGCAASPPPSHPAPTASVTLPAEGATGTPGDPRAQVLGAYTGMWHAYAAAARTASYQPGPLSQYAAGNALMVLTRSLYDNNRHGVVARGAPVLHPRVTRMSPSANPDISAVTDCADDTRWREYTTAGQAASGGAPAGRHRIFAQLRLFGSAWKVTYLVVQKAGTC